MESETRVARRRGRLSFVAVGLSIALTLTGCQLQPSTAPPPADTASPASPSEGTGGNVDYDVGQVVEIWTQASSRGEGYGEAINDLRDAHPTPIVFTNEEAWEVWVDTLPEPLIEHGRAIEPDFTDEALLMGSYDDCMMVPSVDHVGDGQLQFTAQQAQEVDCGWSPSTVVIMSIPLSTLAVDADDVGLA
ncbi:MAG TPA: hypothetical protein H9830_10835 [Candidatus Agrococcus pullicola]|uniref:Lipoprotein n=1 Tax=Candidatus Agrococcus pullicola TaxID=2838429 RepID=A0A9D1YW04_9MICO|nr:hypothetical protein [Candidatus Agrococcus pullicola]